MMILRPIQNLLSQMFLGKPWESAFPYVPLPQFSSVQAISHVWLFVTSWTAARQASLSITSSQSSLKLMSIESVMPSNHLILCYALRFLPSIFPSIRVFSIESVLHIRWPKYWSFSFSISLFPINIQHWFPLGSTGWISLQSKGLSRVFSNTTVQKHQFFSAQLSFSSPRQDQIHNLCGPIQTENLEPLIQKIIKI